MKSFATPDFWQTYSRLPPSAQEQARKAYQLWKGNQSHPLLHLKKVGNNFTTGHRPYPTNRAAPHWATDKDKVRLWHCKDAETRLFCPGRR